MPVATTNRFFTDVLGLEISDEVEGIIAFEVDDIDDVVRGGQHLVDIDPDQSRTPSAPDRSS